MRRQIKNHLKMIFYLWPDIINERVKRVVLSMPKLKAKMI